MIGSGRLALDAAARALEDAGYAARVWRDDVTGDALTAAHDHARLAADLQPGEALLSGGETTVTVPAAAGRGGRNTTFLLALALAAPPGLYALAADTDGVDGTAGAAGAVLTPDTLARAAHLGLNAPAHLARGDAGGFFHALGDALLTGPTGTNVNDLRVLLRTP
ncbi:MOFRL family protein [Deinococcus maricopensis]|uniref:MOFRL family protein n=1 Tax=Deinococcus maricopensis TaxID=309887 RepID=UPI000693F1FE|nr:MOFRL family protein [Deinococcus maricopensis]